MSREFKVSLRHNLAKMTDASSARFALGGVLVESDENTSVAIATDGRGMVIAPVDASYTDDNSAKFENPELIAGKACEGVTSRKDLTVIANGRCESRGKVFDRPEGRYPNWRQVLPKIDTLGTVAVSLTPSIVRRLLEAIDTSKGDEPVTLLLQYNEHNVVEKPIAVVSSSEAIGVLMPCGFGKEKHAASRAVATFNSLRETYQAIGAEPKVQEPEPEPADVQPAEPVQTEPEPVPASVDASAFLAAMQNA